MVAEECHWAVVEGERPQAVVEVAHRSHLAAAAMVPAAVVAMGVAGVDLAAREQRRRLHGPTVLVRSVGLRCNLRHNRQCRRDPVAAKEQGLHWTPDVVAMGQVHLLDRAAKEPLVEHRHWHRLPGCLRPMRSVWMHLWYRRRHQSRS